MDKYTMQEEAYKRGYDEAKKLLIELSDLFCQMINDGAVLPEEIEQYENIMSRIRKH